MRGSTVRGILTVRGSTVRGILTVRGITIKDSRGRGSTVRGSTARDNKVRDNTVRDSTARCSSTPVTVKNFISSETCSSCSRHSVNRKSIGSQ